jgi:hypothetical protein
MAEEAGRIDLIVVTTGSARPGALPSTGCVIGR